MGKPGQILVWKVRQQKLNPARIRDRGSQPRHRIRNPLLHWLLRGSPIRLVGPFSTGATRASLTSTAPLSRNRKVQSHSGATASTLLQRVVLAQSPSITVSPLPLPLQESDALITSRPESTAVESVNVSKLPVENTDSRFASSTLVQGTSQDDASAPGELSGYGVAAPQATIFRQTANTAVRYADITADTANPKDATGTNATQRSISPSATRILVDGTTSRQTEEASQISGFRNVASPQVRTVATELQQSAISSRPTPDTSKLSNSISPQIQEISLQDVAHTVRSYFGRAESQLSSLDNQGFSEQAPGAAPTSAAGSAPTKGVSIPVAIESMLSSPAARTPGNSNALPFSGGFSQNNGPGGAGLAKSSDAVSTSGDGKDNQSQTAAGTTQAWADSSTIGNLTAGQEDGNSSRPTRDTSILSNSISPQIQEISLQDVAHMVGSYFGRAESVLQLSSLDDQGFSVQAHAAPSTSAASSVPMHEISIPAAIESMLSSPVAGTPGNSNALPLSGGVSQNNGPGGAGLAKNSNGVSTSGDGKPQTQEILPQSVAGTADGYFGRAESVMQPAPLNVQESSPAPTTPSGSSASVPAHWIPLSVAMQSMLSSPVARTPGSSVSLPLSGGASQDSGPSGAGLAKTPSGVSVVGAGSENQSQTGAITSPASTHNSTTGNETAQQQGANSSRAIADTTKAASASSPQTQVISQQDGTRTVGSYFGRAESAPQLSLLGDQGSPVQAPATSPTSISGSVLMQGVSFPVAMQNMFSFPVANAAGSSNALPFSGEALQIGDTGGAGLAKTSSGVSTSGDGKDNQNQTAAITPPASAHNPTTGDQTAQQGANSSRPAPGTSQLANSNSLQVQGSRSAPPILSGLRPAEASLHRKHHDWETSGSTRKHPEFPHRPRSIRRV